MSTKPSHLLALLAVAALLAGCTGPASGNTMHLNFRNDGAEPVVIAVETYEDADFVAARSHLETKPLEAGQSETTRVNNVPDPLYVWVIVKAPDAENVTRNASSPLQVHGTVHADQDGFTLTITRTADGISVGAEGARWEPAAAEGE